MEKFVEGNFESEIIVKDVTIVKKKNEKIDPIILAKKSIFECFNLIIIEQNDYQMYLDGMLNNQIKVDYINKNYYYFKNKWPLMKKREFTIFTLPPPMNPIERVSI